MESQELHVAVQSTMAITMASICFLATSLLIGSIYINALIIGLFILALLRQADMFTILLPERKSVYDEKVAWVTGASSGIGLSLCKALTARGAYVIMSGRSISALEKAKSCIQAENAAMGIYIPGDHMLLLPFDLINTEEIPAHFTRAVQWKGHIDFLFNNGGITSRGTLLPYNCIESVLKINLLAQIRLSKLFVDHVASSPNKQNQYHIVFTNSAQARICIAGREPYTVSKRALLTFAESLQRDCKSRNLNICVSSIIAGYVKTNLAANAAGRSGLPKPGGLFVSAAHSQGMSPDVVATLILRGVSNRLREIWVSSHPVLCYLYVAYYAPFLMDFITLHQAKKHGEQSDRDVEIFQANISQASGSTQ